MSREFPVFSDESVVSLTSPLVLVQILTSYASMRGALFCAALALAGACSDRPHDRSADGELDGDQGTPELAAAVARDSDLRRANDLIASGHAWRATVVLAPVLRDAKRRTPAAVLLAARAAAGWDGWTEVDRLLAKETWLDSSYGGEGRELLARSALAQNADSVALSHATLAVQSATNAESRATRQAYLARAYDRRNDAAPASAAYADAAEGLAAVRDWLLLRAAGAQTESALRERAYARVSSGVARARIPWTEAQARERFGDAAGAATRFASLGAMVASLRIRLAIASDSVERERVKQEIIRLIQSRSGSQDARAAIEVLDRGSAQLTPADELAIARSAAGSGPAARAVSGFERAQRGGINVSAADRLQYAQALSRVGRSRDAIAQLRGIQGPLAAQAAYQRGRFLLSSGARAEARTALREVVARFPNDTFAAASALFLLGDLATDDGADARARAAFMEVYRRFPTSARAADARFQAAILAFVVGDARAAARAFDSLVTVAPRSDEATAARYWSGRAWTAAGNAATAKTRWREVIRSQPLSYYSGASARRLSEAPWAPADHPDSFPRVADVDSAIARIELLERLGMDAEVRFELDALDASASSSIDRLLATAHAFREHGEPTRAIRLSRTLIDRGERDARVYRLAYPVVDREELTRVARARGLDPAFVAAIIRQESGFNPRAVSVAGARGLMQVMPAVGQEVAQSLRFPVWYPSLLFDADANLDIGTSHLSAFMGQYRVPMRVLAAYNAGGSRVSRWSAKPGTSDPEIFAERIPFAETRDYVRIVTRNAEIYKALYKW
jgi:soluble lytic murein transglycosylase